MFVRLGVLCSLLLLAALNAGCFIGGSSGSEETPPAATSGGSPVFQRSPSAGTAAPTASGSPRPAQSPVVTSPSPGTATAAATATPTVAASPIAVNPVGEPFQIAVNAAVNVRDRPATTGEIVAGIYPGERAKVIGEAKGQEAEAGKGDIWYQVEITKSGSTVRGFVYAPLTVKG